MTLWAVVALGLAGGVPAWAGLSMAALLVEPVVTTVALSAIAIAGRVTRPRQPDAEIAILTGLAGELRAGLSLRQALTRVDPQSMLARLSSVGAPMEDLTDAVRAALPQSANLVVPALAMLGATGGPAAPVFELLAAGRATEVALARDLAAAKAPARLSASLILGLVIVSLLWLAGSGRLLGLLSDPAGQVLVTAGAVFMAAGTGWVGMMLRGSR